MNLDDHRRRHDQAATLAALLVAGLGCAGHCCPSSSTPSPSPCSAPPGSPSSSSPLRAAIRVVRERREDAADLLAGAAWRAEHMPHLPPQPHPLPRRRAAGAGVA